MRQHEAALTVVFESGIQHISDSAESIRALPKDYRTFLKQLPTTWDESHLLTGYPGKDAVIARRNGKRWFIAGINVTHFSYLRRWHKYLALETLSVCTKLISCFQFERLKQ